MKWRNPDIELPEDNTVVWIMLEPHKNRGSLLDSSPSIEIVCGWAFVRDGECRVENMDELGLGSLGWDLKAKEYHGGDTRAIAWMPEFEMILPDWIPPTSTSKRSEGER